MSFKLASFPNSRFKFRSPTRVRDVDRVTINDAAGPNVQIIGDNVNRTDVTIQNLGNNAFVYDYFDNPNILNEGTRVEAGVILQEDTLSAIWARHISDVDALPQDVGVNEGEG